MWRMILWIASWLWKRGALTADVMPAVFFLSGCSAVQYLPDNEYFYEGSSVNFERGGSEPKERQELKQRLLQHSPYKGNGKIFGSRPSVWFYHIPGDPKESAVVRRFIKYTLGTPPVFLSQLSPEAASRRMATELNNAGYFKSTVRYKIIKNEKRRDSEIVYTVSLQPEYYLNEISYPKTKEDAFVPVFQGLQKTSLVQPRQRYDLKMLSDELLRLEKVFRDSGYFYFDDRYLMFEADSTVGGHQVDLRLTVRQELPEKARAIYKLGKPLIYIEDQPFADTSATKYNTIASTNSNLFYSNRTRENFVKPAMLARVLNLKPGDTYSLRSHEIAMSRLTDLGIFKMVNIKYVPSLQDSSLTPHILLNPMLKKTFQSEIKVVSKSNNTIGPVISLKFTNRNLLKGAEKLEISISGAYETQFSNQSSGTLNAFEVKALSTLTINQFLLPFKINYGEGRYMPKTIIKVETSLHNRVDYYDIKSFSTSWGYFWRNKKGILHELYPVDISYVNTTNISTEFSDVLRLNPSLALSLQDQFIIGPRYVYTINEQYGEHAATKNKWRYGSWYFKGGVELSGNLLDAIMKRTREDEQRPYELLQSPFSQFAKGDADVRYRWQINPSNKIVTRIIVGAGYAYGNATTMPFVKQYAIGGASSLRAFPARTVGPGTFNIKELSVYSEDSISFTDQYADIKMEGNVEYRFGIYKAFKAALFVDAGNIWTFREDSIRAGGKFKADQFYKQIAMGAGVGLRLDLGFFIIRLDTAIPIRTPYDGWTFREIDFTDSAWRKENLVVNIAVGYPF